MRSKLAGGQESSFQLLADRLSFFALRDQVLVLHDQLISKPGGFYAKLYGMQDQTLEILESDFAVE
jgi:hypothetical protein